MHVQACCLMTNDVHVVVPSAEDSPANALGRTYFLYTQAINRLQRHSGHLWQNRFYSCPLDEVHCWTAVCYVERNLVRARMVRKTWRYPWSSAHAHVSGEDRNKLLSLSRWPQREGGRRWQRQLESPQEDEVLGRMRWGEKGDESNYPVALVGQPLLALNWTQGYQLDSTSHYR